MGNQSRTILLIGYYGAGNVGDEAVLTAILRELRTLGGDTLRFVVPGEDPEQLTSRHGVESFSMWDGPRLVEALRQVDGVLVGGGGLLHDYSFHDPLLMFSGRHWGLPYYCGLPWLAAELGLPVMLYAVGIGPLVYPHSREMVRDLGACATAITVRDELSRGELTALGVPAARVRVTADPAWGLVPEAGDLAGTDIPSGDGWLAVVTRNWPFSGGQERWEKELAEGLTLAARDRGLRLAFVPFQRSAFAAHDDVRLAERLADRVSRVESVVLDDSRTPEEIAAVLGGCEAVVAMRYHAMLLAALASTPSVGIAYDPKVTALAEAMAPAVSCLDLEGLHAEALSSSVLDLLDRAAGMRESIQEVVEVQRSAASVNPAMAVESVLGRGRSGSSDVGQRVAQMMTAAGELRRQRMAVGDPDPKSVAAPSQPPHLEVVAGPSLRVLAPAFFDFEGEVMYAGGAERYLVELVRLANEMGFEAEVLQTAGEVDWERSWGDGLTVHGIATGGHPDRLATIVEERGIPTAALTVFLAFDMAASVRHLNTIGISHGVFWDDPIYHGAGGVDPAVRSRVMAAARNLDTIVSVDANTINWFRATDVELAERCVHIPNFVDLKRFRPPAKDRDERDGVEVLFPRRLSAVRGFWLLADVLPRLLESNPQVRVRLLGQATEGWEQGAVQDAVERLLKRHPHRLAWSSLDPDGMPEAYAQADVVVIPTLASEGTSLSCLEAQACGCAVVATAVGGLAELVIDGFNATLIPPEPAALLAALERLASDPELRRRLGRNAIQTARGHSLNRWRSQWRSVLRAHRMVPEGAVRVRKETSGRDEETKVGKSRSQADAEEPAAMEELRDCEVWLSRLRRRLAEERARTQLLLEQVQEEVTRTERLSADARVSAVTQELRSAETRGQELSTRLKWLEVEAEEHQLQLQEQEDNLAEMRLALSALEAERVRLTEANAVLAWKARGILGRALDRTLKPRQEGRITYYLRTLYYGVARTAMRVLGRRRGLREGPLLNPYKYAFLTYRRKRERACGMAVPSLQSGGEPGLVSVVLPVFNGARLVEQAIESVLSQTWEQLELIVVDDGSTDGTGAIVDRIAARDKRVLVIHQENQRLPRALSNGFRAARGEFLSWTSDDNRLKPQFLERMVDCLRRHPEWDMAFANEDIIGEDGTYLHGSEWFSGYQVPPGSPHIHLPADVSELNTYPNNSVGAAFLYRRRVRDLVGDYSPNRFSVEDYDYWMLVNDLLTLRHADFDEPVYDYRFHDASLTARDGELRILERRQELMVFDDFRRDFNLTPLTWVFPDDGVPEEGRARLERLRQLATEAGHVVGLPGSTPLSTLPSLWYPTVAVAWADGLQPPTQPPQLPKRGLGVLLAQSGQALAMEAGKGWDVRILLDGTNESICTEDPTGGPVFTANLEDAFTAIDIMARVRSTRAIEDAGFDDSLSEVEATVVVCTNRRSEILEPCLRAVASQSVAHERFEVLVVNNDPSEPMDELVATLRDESFSDHPGHLRLVVCPIKGLSFARNAAIAEARGEILCFLDDDAVAEPDWLQRTLETFAGDPAIGVVGGRILLRPPDPAPTWLRPELWSYWSHFSPGGVEPKEAEEWWQFPWGANWSARRSVLLKIGGFRHRYGRKGADFGGGEEIVAASLVRGIGAKVVLQPASRVHHHVDAARFTRRDLRQMIRKSTIVNYALQRDLYVPRWVSPLRVLESLLGRLWRVVGVPRKGGEGRLVAWYGLRADLSLLRLLVSEYLDRLQLTG
ncbi:MAG: glycosyltransferase [Acidobacteria bacterium]|nr:glycosyltransferase [Acidobacteriota bacterium]